MELQRRSERDPVVTNAHQCIYLYPYEDWATFEERLVGLSSVDTNYDAFRRFFISGANECAIDTQGRLLIPPYLREHADLKREVTIAGVGERIEIRRNQDLILGVKWIKRVLGGEKWYGGPRTKNWGPHRCFADVSLIRSTPRVA